MKNKAIAEYGMLIYLCFAATSAMSTPVLPNISIFENTKNLFDIPLQLDIELTLEGWETSDGVQTSRYSFKSLDNGYATGTIARPIQEGRYPVIIVMYGLSHKPAYSRNPGINLSSQTDAVYVSFDPPLHRTDRANGIGSGILRYGKDQERNEQIQLIRDLRILVSVLSKLYFIDNNQIAFYGYSYGAAMGGILAAVEPRLRALVLASGSGGRYSLRTEDPMYDVDPIHYAIHMGNTPVLLQNGEDDQVVNYEVASLYHRSFRSENKELRWYPEGHFLSCEATKDAIAWLSAYIKLENSSSYECTNLPIL